MYLELPSPHIVTEVANTERHTDRRTSAEQEEHDKLSVGRDGWHIYIQAFSRATHPL